MLVLVSFALVLAATVLLVLGLLSDGGLPLIYTSIACSAAAGLVLLVAVRLSRPTPAAAGAGPEALREREPAPAREPALATVGGGTSTVTARIPLVEEGGGPEARHAEAGASEAWAPEEAWNGEFPIAEYDELKVSEIMPLLPELYADELDLVEERERQGKNRATVLNRIAELRSEAGDGDGAPADEAEDDDFPIADYDELTVAEIRGLLPELDDDELDMVRGREEQGQSRVTILKDIDRLLEGEPAPAPARTTVRKPAAKKRAGKRAPAKKTAAKKRAAKRAPAKKTAAKKSAAKGSTAKKSTAKKRGSTRR